MYKNGYILQTYNFYIDEVFKIEGLRIKYDIDSKKIVLKSVIIIRKWEKQFLINKVRIGGMSYFQN